MNKKLFKTFGSIVGAFAGLLIAELLMREAPYKEAAPICGCGHHFSMHDEEGCHYSGNNKVMVERGAPREIEDSLGYKSTAYDLERYDYIPTACGCRRYTGPEPLPSYTPALS